MKNQNKEVLLSVQNLCQYFKMNRRDFKAVDGISFDIYKGEVFGLVGESGCGKTTTGRSIIKIYDITSGDIYFKGVRIAAGIRSYQDEIKKIRSELRKKARLALKGSEDEKAAFAEFKKESQARIDELKLEIVKARHDQKNCDKDYAKLAVKETQEKYEKLLAEEQDLAKKKHFKRL